MVVPYKVGWFQAAILFRLRGSVFKDALLWAVPCACLSSILKAMDQAGNLGSIHQIVSPAANNAAFSGISFLVGFIIVFRTGQSYSRFMDSMNSVHQMMGEWLDCACSIVSFAKSSSASPEERSAFLHTVIRLFSVLSASALQELTVDQGGLKKVSAEHGRQRTVWLETIDRSGLDLDTVNLLDEGKLNTPLLVYQWIQQAVLQQQHALLSSIPAPILARAFNELSAGMTKFHDTLLLSHMPFPFPYAQTTVTLLIMHWGLTPLVMVQWTNYPWSAWVFTFVQVFILWALNAIATGIERPFAGQPNDINPYIMQKSMNTQLLNLINPKASKLPRLAIGCSLEYSELRNKWAKDRKKNDTAYNLSLRQEGWRERLRHFYTLAREHLRRSRAPAQPAEPLSEPLSALKEPRCSQHVEVRVSNGGVPMDPHALCSAMDRRPSTSTVSGRGPFSPTPGHAAGHTSSDGAEPRPSYCSGSGAYLSLPIPGADAPVGQEAVPTKEPSSASLANMRLPQEHSTASSANPRLPQDPSTASLATTELLRGEASGLLQATASTATQQSRSGAIRPGSAQDPAEFPKGRTTSSEGWLGSAASPHPERSGKPATAALPGVPDGEAGEASLGNPEEFRRSSRAFSASSSKGVCPMAKKAGDAAWGDGDEIQRTTSNRISQSSLRAPGPSQEPVAAAAPVRKASVDTPTWTGDAGPEVQATIHAFPKVDSSSSIVEVDGRAGHREASTNSLALPDSTEDEVTPITTPGAGPKADAPPLIRVESVHSLDGSNAVQKALLKEKAVFPEPPPNTPPRLTLGVLAADPLGGGGDPVFTPRGGEPPQARAGLAAGAEAGGGVAAATSAATTPAVAATGADGRQLPLDVEAPVPASRVSSHSLAPELGPPVPPTEPGRQAELPQRLPGSPRGSPMEALPPELSRAASGSSVHAWGGTASGGLERVSLEAAAEVARAAGAGVVQADAAQTATPELPPGPWHDPARQSETHGETTVVPQGSEPGASSHVGSLMDIAPDIPEASAEQSEGPDDDAVPSGGPRLERMESNASDLLGGKGGFLPF